MLIEAKDNTTSFTVFKAKRKTAPSQERMVSVDALRGFDMFWIMGGYQIFTGLDKVFHNRATQFITVQLDHAAWFGFHFYDIIMPLFLFLTGVSMVFSYKKRLTGEGNYKALWQHTIKRVLILWVLGMMVQGRLLTYDINQIQLYSNTLQAIASGYLIATVIVLYLPVSYQVLTTLSLLLVYWGIVALVPVGGSTAGAYSITGNVPLLFDHLVLGRFHDGLEYTWIISSLNFGATTMLGVFCSYILQSHQAQKQKVINLIFLGLALIALGWVWNLWHPIIKKMWTGSFVLFSGGICTLMLALFYLAIDVLQYKRGITWLVIIGSNAIFSYVAWHLFEPSFTAVSAVFIDGLKPYIGNWYDTVLYTGSFMVLFFLLKYMYHKKIFIKI